MQYNGEPFKLEKSHKVFQDFLSNEIFTKKHKEWREQIERISFVDVHTGLGKYGYDTLVADVKLDGNVEYIGKLFPEHKKEELIVDTRKLLGGTYENANGYIYEHIHNIINGVMDGKKMDNLIFTQEFGTYHGIWIMSGMRFENGFTQSYYDYINGDNVDENVRKKMLHLVDIARKRYRSLFYIERVDWKTDIVTKGVDLFTKVFNR